MHPMPAAWGLRRFRVLLFFPSAMAPNPGSCPAPSGSELSQRRGQDLRSEFLLPAPRVLPAAPGPTPEGIRSVQTSKAAAAWPRPRQL